MRAASDPTTHDRTVPRSRPIVDGLVVAGTFIVILAVALVPLLTGWVMHPVLDAAHAAAWLDTDDATAHALSDRTVTELMFGPGTFAFPGPAGSAFYDTAEIEHLHDVRTLLWLLLGAATLSVLGIALALVRSDRPARIVRAVGLGGLVTAVVVVILGILGVFAFDPMFELFHRLFFPQGDWAFDPRTSHLVQLYPFDFWQIISAALGVVMAVLGVIVWLVARTVVGPGDQAAT